MTEKVITETTLDLQNILTQLRINNNNILTVLEYFELYENIPLFRSILKNINRETYRDLFIEYLSGILIFHQKVEKSALILSDETDKIRKTLQESYDFTMLSESKNVFIEEISYLYPLIKNKLLYSYISKVYGRLLKYNLTPKSLESITDLFSKIDGLITNRRDLVNHILSYDDELADILGSSLKTLLNKNYVRPLLNKISTINNVYSGIFDSIHIEAVHNLKFFKEEKNSKELIVTAKQFTNDVLQKFFLDEHYEQNVSLLLYSSKYKELKKHLSASLVNRSKAELMSNKTDAEALIYRLILSNKTAVE